MLTMPLGYSIVEHLPIQTITWISIIQRSKDALALKCLIFIHLTTHLVLLICTLALTNEFTYILTQDMKLQGNIFRLLKMTYYSFYRTSLKLKVINLRFLYCYKETMECVMVTGLEVLMHIRRTNYLYFSI